VSKPFWTQVVSVNNFKGHLGDSVFFLTNKQTDRFFVFIQTPGGGGGLWLCCLPPGRFPFSPLIFYLPTPPPPQRVFQKTVQGPTKVSPTFLFFPGVLAGFFFFCFSPNLSFRANPPTKLAFWEFSAPVGVWVAGGGSPSPFF